LLRLTGHARPRAAACPRRGEFHLAALDQLPLPDDYVDVIVCALALVHVPRLQPAPPEFARALRPGGDLVISDVHHDPVTRGSVVSPRPNCRARPGDGTARHRARAAQYTPDRRPAASNVATTRAG
jgi:ubiquinone/menaquinone biosynthesis C-methylase UbiE